MKNLKKLMSVVLTVAMLMSLIVSTSAASFTDVDDTNAAYEAIEVLSALEILTGREDGSFDPDANIKRSEFAAVICRTMNAEAAATGSSANFNDVAADHWAAGYIGWAAGSGIVNGKGNGNFDPDANVTYQEAVTMIVRAMGFDPLAVKRGGFPTGYMAVANTYGITNGVAMSPASGAATRAGVAKLVYNSFDAPLMDASFITFGEDEEYTIFEGKTYNGSYDERRTLLSQYSDIYKIKATVEDTYRSDANLIKSNGDMQISLQTVANGLYKFPIYQLMNELGLAEIQLNGTVNNPFTALFNDTTVGDLLGYTVNAYLAVNEDGDLEVIALVPDMKSIESITFEDPATEIASIKVAGATATPVPNAVEFTYWENDRQKDAKMATADNVEVYLNGENNGLLSAYGSPAPLYDGTYNSVTLLGSKATGLYDKILLTQYAHYQVESVDTELMVITTNHGDISLNEDDVKDNFVYSIIKDGAEIELADIAEGDILNIISDNALDFTDADFADIYVSNKTVEASVSQYNSNSGEYTIDGAQYKLANDAEISSLNAGDAGIFYLTIDGYIYNAELTKGFSGNYAFVIDMALDNSNFGKTWQIKMLTKDNTIATYDVKNNVKVDNLTKKNDACTGVVAPIAQPSATPIPKCTCDQCAALNDLYAAVKDTSATAKTNAWKRLISYNLSGDEISVIDFAAYQGDDKEFNYDTLNGKYNDRTEQLDSYNLLSGTVVFNAPFAADNTLDENKIQVYTVDGLEDDQNYTGFVYDVDSDIAIGATLITSNMGFAGKANALAVVKSVSTGLDAAGNSADIINFFQAGEMKSLAVSTDAGLTIELSAGDIIQYTTNAAGEINNLVTIFNMEETSAPSASPETKAYVGGVIDASNDVANKIEYHVGVVKDISSKYIKLSNNYQSKTLGWDLNENGTNVLFDVAKAGASLNNAFSAKTGTGYIREAKDNSGAYTTDVYVAVVKVDDGAVVEVVTYKYDKATAGTTAFEAKFDKQ